MLTVLGISLVLQYGHCMKLVDQSSAQLMGQLAEQSWPSVSDLVEDVDFDRTFFEASEGHDSAVDDVVADEHAKQAMETTLLQMRSTSFKEALRSKSEFRTLSASHQHQYYKGTESLQQISKSPALEHFMTEAMPKLTASVKQDASFMAFLKDAAGKFPQPTDQSSEAGAPLLKELGSMAPRIAKYLVPRMQTLLKSDNHVAFLQEPEGPVEEGDGDEVGAAGGDTVAEWLDKTGLAGDFEEDEDFATIVPRSNVYWRTQTGFHVPIPLNPSCTGACVYLDVGLMLVKLIDIAKGKLESGPCFIIMRPGFLFRMSWGLINVRVYLPTVGAKDKPVGPLNTRKYGWEAGYTYNENALPGEDNTINKYGGWVLGTGIATKRIACPTKDKKNLDSFWFAEPMFGIKISFRGVFVFWLPMVRAGRSAEDTGHQVFAVFQPLTAKTGVAFDYPKLVGVTIGQLRNRKLPDSKAGDQCKEELAEENAAIQARNDARHAKLANGLEYASKPRVKMPGEDAVGDVSGSVDPVKYEDNY